MSLVLIRNFILSTIVLLGSALNAPAQITQQEKHVEVALRMVGHKILLLDGDSGSRILPIKWIDEQYNIEFETQFSILPDSLISVFNTVFREARITNAYFVEVLSCENREVVYSYEKSPEDSLSIFPCAVRRLPRACYIIQLSLKDKEEISLQPKLPKESRNTSEFSIYLFIFIGFIMLLIISAGLRKWKISRKPKDLLVIGRFYFDKRNTELILKEERIELSSKESDLLSLLYEKRNQTVERELILKVVWGDEGDYVGRTLDVFISKLRKKLEADPEVKIVNIRGIGYKLLVSE